MFQIDWFKDDIAKYERRVYTEEMLDTKKQFKEDMDLIKRAREIDMKRKLESLVESK